jgi:hypothetical protein
VLLHWLRQFSILTNKRLFVNVETQPTSKSCPVVSAKKLPAKKYLEVVKTNREFAKKYAISPRTVTTWRKEGCPFEDGQWAVLDWLAERRYAPAGAKSEVWEAT